MITLTILLLAIPCVLIIALFSRRGFTIDRQIRISQPISHVFGYLALLKRQDEFHHQFMIDPKMKKEFTGIDGSAGSIYAWESKNPRVGKAQQKIIQISRPNKIEIEVVFEKPFKSKALLLMELEPVTANETNVRWIFRGNEHPYYLLRVGHLLFRVKKAVTTDLEQSLQSLKTKLEQS